VPIHVRYWGQSGHDADIAQCPLLTQSGHLLNSDVTTSSGRAEPATMLPAKPGSAMRRRDFIKGIAGSATVWTYAARAQQPAMPVIGYLSTGTPESDAAPFLAAFREGLRVSVSV